MKISVQLGFMYFMILSHRLCSWTFWRWLWLQQQWDCWILFQALCNNDLHSLKSMVRNYQTCPKWEISSAHAAVLSMKIIQTFWENCIRSFKIIHDYLEVLMDTCCRARDFRKIVSFSFCYPLPIYKCISQDYTAVIGL